MDGIEAHRETLSRDPLAGFWYALAPISIERSGAVAVVIALAIIALHALVRERRGGWWT